MQNEPKLASDVEKRFDEEFVNKLEPHGGDGNLWPGEEGIEYWDTLKYAEDEGKVEQIKAFIATELERQRLEYVTWAKTRLEKCNRLVNSEFASQSPDYFKGKIAILNDLLNILKKARE